MGDLLTRALTDEQEVQRNDRVLEAEVRIAASRQFYYRHPDLKYCPGFQGSGCYVSLGPDRELCDSCSMMKRQAIARKR